MADTLIHRRVASARDGTNPMVIARMRSGWAVMGDRQVLAGYSLLLPDPVVPDLNALSGAVRATFLEDMARLGDALLHVTGARRINYEILGNSEPALHAHLFPRYDDEPPELGRRQRGSTTGPRLQNSFAVKTRRSFRPSPGIWVNGSSKMLERTPHDAVIACRPRCAARR